MVYLSYPYNAVVGLGTTDALQLTNSFHFLILVDANYHPSRNV